MVRFDEEGYTIEVTTGSSPIPEWAELYRALLALLGQADQEALLPGQLCVIADFLEQMLPADRDLARMG